MTSIVAAYENRITISDVLGEFSKVVNLEREMKWCCSAFNNMKNTMHNNVVITSDTLVVSGQLIELRTLTAKIFHLSQISILYKGN